MPNKQIKTVVITGASSGFGKACVPLFLKDGWIVIATMRHSSSRAAQLFQAHENLFHYELDVTSKQDRDNLVKFIIDQFDAKIDCLINNAGFGAVGVLESVSESAVEKQMSVNLIGLTHMIQCTLPFLRKAKGRIINITSVLGYTGFPVASLYCASKFAVEGLSESLLYELAPHDVQVAVVEPGRHHTEFGNNLLRFEPDNLHNELYKKQMHNYSEMLKSSKMNFSGNPETVADCIFKLANCRVMPFKTRVGADAAVSYWARRLLPSRMYYWVLKNVYSKLLTQ